MRIIIAFAAAMLSLSAIEPAVAARAGGCEIQQVASVDLLMGPLTKAIYIQASFNDVTKYLLVDTGGIDSTLSHLAARDLGLMLELSPTAEQNVAGQSTGVRAEVRRFAFGSFRATPTMFLVLPSNDVTFVSSTQLAGTLASDILSHYDVEFDFAAAKMNLFRSTDCVISPYWPHAAEASTDVEIGRNGHIFFPMVLDGQRVRAALDTGMSITSLSLDTARKTFGIDPDASHLEKVGTLTGDARGTVYGVTMHTLATENGQISVANPHLHLLPDLTTPDERHREEPPQLIMGLSMLKHLHIYIAYHQHKLFVTEASGPPAVTVQIPGIPDQSANPLGRKPQ